MFVQWLLTDDRRKTQTDRVTVPVKEMNEAEWMNVESVTYRDGVFRIVYTSRGSREIPREAKLAPGPPGEYTLEK